MSFVSLSWGGMSGIEETIVAAKSVGCFTRLFKCCRLQDDEEDGGFEYTDIKLEFSFVCCGGNN